jgi:Flp pilus assembly protein TadD
MDERIKKADELMKQGKSSLAVSIIKDILKEMPEDPYLYYLLGIARMKCMRFFLAKRALEKADQLLPNHAENLRSLGWVKVMLGQVEEGRNDLRRAINLDLMNHLSYIDLAMSYFHYFDFKEGEEWLERARALAPKDPYVLQNFKTAKEMEKEYSKYSVSELQEIQKEKLDPKYQRFFRISMLQKYYTGKPLTRDEAEEVQKEAQLNGAPASIITEKQEREAEKREN